MVTSARHPDLRRGTGSGPDGARVGMPVAGVIAVLLVVLTLSLIHI